MDRGDYKPPSKDPFDLLSAALFGGISGFPMPVPSIELAVGLRLRSTYAHLIMPLILAFAPPPKPGAPHGGPWAALNEHGLTIHIEVQLDAGARPFGFDRPNTLWFVTAMLRLRLALPLQLPVISDRPLETVTAHLDRVNLVPVELNIRQFLTAESRKPTEADFYWLRDNIDRADILMNDPAFRRALQTFDGTANVSHSGASIVIAWASLETLLRPGQHKITERICRALAAYLEPPGRTRDRAFTRIAACYEARGGAAHAGTPPEKEQLQTAFRLARATLMKSIEIGSPPDVEQLLGRGATRYERHGAHTAFSTPMT